MDEGSLAHTSWLSKSAESATMPESQNGDELWLEPTASEACTVSSEDEKSG